MKRRLIDLLVQALAICLLSCSVAINALAEDPELRAFVDGVMQSHLSARTTVGATVSVVQDNAVLLSAGYGYADVSAGRTVNPAQTLFRVGSISKVLVWMSVLQQVERAGASLDDDVAGYLESVTLDQRFPAPVTLRHLMTHTPGFEDRAYGLFTDSQARVPALVDYLRANVPQQQWVPGEMVAYSNYGAALAARIVENLAGESFDDYVREAILAPLGMRSTFSQAFVDSSKDRLAQGYSVVDGEPVRQSIEYVVPAPAGALSASADDIAQLMLELLNPVSSSIMTSDAKALLLQRADDGNPAVNGRTLGLYELTHGDGERAVGHGGDTMLFHSRMVLWPQQRLGLFISTNTLTGNQAVENLVDAFVARYGLGDATDTAQQVNTGDGTGPGPAALQAIAGHYGMSRREYSGPLKLMALLTQAQVSRSADGSALLVQSLLGNQKYRARGDRLFYAADEIDRFEFVPGSSGPDRIRSSAIPVIDLVRLPWFERLDINVGFLLLVLLLNVLVLVRLPYTAVTRRKADHSASGRASLVAWVMACIILATAVLYVMASPDPVHFFTGGYRQLEQLNWSWLLVALGAGAQFLLTLSVWRHGRWWLARRGFYSLVALANLSFAGWMYYWNLHPFSLPAS